MDLIQIRKKIRTVKGRIPQRQRMALQMGSQPSEKLIPTRLRKDNIRGNLKRRSEAGSVGRLTHE